MGINPDVQEQFQMPQKIFEGIWFLMYVLTGISIALIITTKNTSLIYWITLFTIVATSLINYSLLINTKNFKKCKYMLLTNVLLLSLQVFASYYINPISGIMLAPVLMWYIYVLIQFKDFSV
jgi:tryptophan-rich sensory protein